MIQKVVRFTSSDGTLASSLKELSEKETAFAKQQVLKFFHVDPSANEAIRNSVAAMSDKIIKNRDTLIEILNRYKEMLAEIETEASVAHAPAASATPPAA